MSQGIDPTQLGLSQDEVTILQQGQAAVAAVGSSSSRAASRASSQGLLLLDASSLAALGRHFDRLMSHIQQQLERLIHQSEVVTMQLADQAGNVIDNADAEIARYHRLMADIDSLELDMDRISNIRGIVRGYRQRAEQLERELEQSQPSSSRSRHHHSSSGHHSSKHKHSSHQSSSRRERHGH